jgi:hypothetical protein
VLDPTGDLLKAALRFVQLHVGEDADELVAADPDQRVVRAEICPNGAGDRPQKPVPGGVSVLIVSRLEAVDVDEGEHKGNPGSARPFDLMVEDDLAHPASVGAGQLVDVRGLQLERRVAPIACGSLAIMGGPRSILRRSRPVRRRVGACGCGGLERPVNGVVEVSPEGLRGCLRLTVEGIGGPVAGLGGAVTLGRGLVALCGVLVALGRRLDPDQRCRIALLLGERSLG